LGKDTITGSAGQGFFEFTTKASSINIDKIVDYTIADDTIWLENAVYTKLGSGSAESPKGLNSLPFAVGTKARDTNDYIIYDIKSGSPYYDADGSDTKDKQELIATFASKVALKYSKIYVI
jgi:hypothetical protein